MEGDRINWLLNGVVGFVLDLITSALDVISKEFYTILKLDGSSTLDLFFGLFMPKTMGGSSNNVWTLCVALGLVILYFNLILGLFKAFFGPLVKAESPLKLVAKFLIFCVLVAYSRYICDLFFDIGTAPYELLSTMSFEGTANIGTAIKDISTTMTNEFQVSGVFADIIKMVFTLFVLCAILINYFKLIIEVAERYVILGILSLAAPMCIATGSSESTANIAKSWVRMMVSQVIVMCMSVLFLRVFEGAVGRVGSIDSWAPSGTGIFLVLVLILAWLRTGQRIDSHMGTLGLTVAQAGNGLYGDMMAGAALAKSAKRTAGKAFNAGAGMIAAGGGRAWAASKQGEQALGYGASMLARASQRIGGKHNPHGAQSAINTAKFDAKNSGIGVARGQSAVNGIQAKYGDAKSKNNPNGKSLNDLLAEGGAIKSASMTADGSGEATVVDKNGNELTMAFGTDKNGDPVVGYSSGDEDALKNAMGPEAEGDMSASDVMNAVGGEEIATSNLDANGDCVMDENGNIVAGGMEEGDLSGLQTADGQDVTGLADESGMVAAGTKITDEDGNTIGIADGEGNMMTEGSFATDTDGNFQDVTGMAGINADGQAIDADGNVMTGADGEAIQMADVGAAGSVGINEDGQFVDANNNPMVDENGNAIMATSDIAMAADGSVFAKGEDGQYHAMADDNGNAVQLGDGQSLSVGADGNIDGVSSGITGINSDGQALDASGNIVTDGDGNAIQMADIGAEGSVGINSDGQFVDAAGNAIEGSSATSDIAMAADGSVFAKGEDGQYHAMADADGNAMQLGAGDSVGVGSAGVGGTAVDGADISSSLASADTVGISETTTDGANISSSLSAADTIGNAGAGATSGSFATANGNIETKTPNGNGTPGMAAVAGGAIAGGVVASLSSGVSTYNADTNKGGSVGSAGGAYAMTSGGMVALGNSIDSNGHVTAGAAGGITPNSNGDGGYSMNVNGSQVAVQKDNSSPTGYSIAGSTYSKAEGTGGAFAVGKDAAGNSMLVQTNSNGGVNRYNKAETGSISLSGDSGAITHSYGEAKGGSGGYVKDNHGNFKPIYQGEGGTTKEGSPERYSPDGNGGYKQDPNGDFVRTSADNANGYNYTNTSKNSGKTFNQTGTHFNGIDVTKNNDGTYGINLSKGASAHSYGNGVIDINTGNGGSVRLLDAAIHQAPEGSMKTTFNGKSYYAVPTSSAAAGHIGGQNPLQQKQNAQSLLNSCNDGGVRNYFQDKYNKGKGVKSNSAATSVIDHKNGSITISSSIEAGKTKDGKTSYKSMTFYPTDKFNSNNPDAKIVSFKGKDYIAVESRKTGDTISVGKGAGISTRKDIPDPSQFGSFPLSQNINYVPKRGKGGAKTAMQRRMDNIDRQEGRR